jgi:hypothetical protein
MILTITRGVEMPTALQRPAGIELNGMAQPPASASPDGFRLNQDFSEFARTPAAMWLTVPTGGSLDRTSAFAG